MSGGEPARGLVAVWATERVPVGAEYTAVLRTPNASPWSSVLGVALGVVSFLTLAPLVTQLLALAYWAAIGRPGAFADTYRSLAAYEQPFGMVAVQLGISILLPLSAALVLLVHRVRPGYLGSVTRRLRWRPFWVFLAVAVLVFNGVLFAQLWLAGTPLRPSPQAGLVWFMAAVLLTSPLQAAAEEVFFRGYLMQALGALVPNHWFGIVSSAAVFALFHGVQNPWLFLDRFAFGLLAGVLVVRTGGLEAAIAAHVVNNVFAFLYAGLTTGIAQLKAVREIGPMDAVGDVLMFGAFALAAYLVARRLGLSTRTEQPGLSPGVRVQ